MRNVQCYVLLIVMAVSGSLKAAGEDLSVVEVEARRSKPLAEIGIHLGTPAGANLAVGMWGTETLPILVRLSGMYLGGSHIGGQADLGYLFNPEASFKHYVAASAMVMDVKTFDWVGIGPSYGFNWNGFTTQVGLSFGGSDLYRVSSPQLTLQLGYSFLF